MASSFCDPTGTNGNLSTAPNFVNQSQNKYQLTAGSPAIDAGEEAAAPAPTRDFAGKTRPIDGNADSVARINIGAFEYDPSAPPSPTPPPPSNNPSSGGGGAISIFELVAYAGCLFVGLRGRRKRKA